MTTLHDFGHAVMHRLSDWPVLARIAARSTTAARLDSRAVAMLYARASEEDRRDMAAAEREFSDAARRAFAIQTSAVTVTLDGNELVAELPTGQHFRSVDAADLARMLIAAGVDADNVLMLDWREGDAAPMVGHRIMILSMLRAAATPEQNAEAYRIALALGIDAPWTPATARSVAEWIAWWQPSASIAEAMPESESKRLWDAGEWPPAAPEHAGRVPPASVRQALRFDDQHCRQTIAAYEKAKKESP